MHNRETTRCAFDLKMAHFIVLQVLIYDSLTFKINGAFICRIQFIVSPSNVKTITEMHYFCCEWVDFVFLYL